MPEILGDNVLKFLLFSIITLIISIQYYYYNASGVSLEVEKCPFCYGVDLCHAFQDKQVAFDNISYSERFVNYISTKNVYVATYNNKKVILKKLGHSYELENIDRIICGIHYGSNCPPYPGSERKDFTSNILNLLQKDNPDIYSNLKICSKFAAEQFVTALFGYSSHLNTNFMTASIWTQLLINVEPLMLQILSKGDWPIPKYYGACGRIIVVEHCGKMLGSVTNEPWLTRASYAYQLLEAAENFTNKHPLFHFYLTDMSPDNIAVTPDNKIKFVDMESIVISSKNYKIERPSVHHSHNFECQNCYAFSTEEICYHGISDHNYYSVCKLLLSKNSPWPMMKNGLLHSTPKSIRYKYPTLLEYIELCAGAAKKHSRFDLGKMIARTLQQILELSDPLEL